MSATRRSIIRTNSADGNEIDWVNIRDPQVTEFNSLVNSLYTKYKELEFDYKNIRNVLWYLHTRTTFTLLPFSDPRLEIVSLVNEVKYACRNRNDLRITSEKLHELGLRLAECTVNSKFEKIKSDVKDYIDLLGANSILLLGNVSRRPLLEGWPIGAVDYVRDSLTGVEVVQSFNDLSSRLPEMLLIPAGGSRLDYERISEISLGGLARINHFYFYDGEKTRSVSTPSLNAGRVVSSYKQPKLHKNYTAGRNYENNAEPEQEDPIWFSLREAASSVEVDELIHQARWVLFEGGEAICLPEGRRVPELSNLIDNPSNSSREVAFVRKDVSSLKVGDVLLVRKSGSGDYLDDVADALMRRNKEGNLREKSMEWRKPLEKAIISEGMNKMKNFLGYESKDAWGDSYSLFQYAYGLVIAPRDKAKFTFLINVLYKYKYIQPSDVNSFINYHWECIDKIRKYQLKAGQEIRSELIDLLQKRISSGDSIVGTEISLNGVDGGVVSLMKINAIDDNVVQVGSSALYKLRM